MRRSSWGVVLGLALGAGELPAQTNTLASLFGRKE